jgi:integrase
MDTNDLRAAHRIDQERRGLLPNSIKKRDDCLKQFARCIAPTELLDVTRADVERFLDARRITNRTRYAWLSHLSGFYQWAIRDDLLTIDPIAKIIRPRLGRSLPRPAATAELRSALVQAPPLYRCWLLLAAYMGLRCQEIAGIRRDDVLDGQVPQLLRITAGKGDKERIIALNPVVLEALVDLPMPRHGWVFTQADGGPYSPANLSHVFNGFLRDAGVHATAHQLRHWCGTTMYSNTHDLRLVQEVLGHSNPTTTALYTAFDDRAAGVAVRAMTFD